MESFLILPMTMTVPLGNLPKSSPIVVAPQVVLSQQLNMEASNILAFNQAVDQKAQTITLENKALAIDTYFKEHDMPLAGMGKKMVEEAENNGLDWRLVAAISVNESTGGKFACKTVKFNPFGWGSCKIGFDSYDDAIETVARNLGGNEPKTAHHYDGKTTEEILDSYNPHEIAPKYIKQMKSIMDDIGDNFTEIAKINTTNTNNKITSA